MTSNDAFWPRTQGPHPSVLSARLQRAGESRWLMCAVLDLGPEGCRVRVKTEDEPPQENSIVTVGFQANGGGEVIRRMRVCPNPERKSVGAGSVDPRVLGLEVLDGPLPASVLMPEGLLDLERAELELVTGHAQRMWQAEMDNHKWLSLRGRVVIASTSGLLGIVAIGLIVAGADAKLNLLAGAGASGDVMFWVGIVSAVGIALGLLACISSVVLYIWHTEEDSGILRTRSDFGNIGRHHFDTQPTIFSVYTPYLFEEILRDERRAMLGRFLKRYEWVRFGLRRAKRWQMRWLVDGYRKHEDRGQRDPDKRRMRRELWLWYRFQWIAIAAPVFRPSNIARRSVNIGYREYIERVYQGMSYRRRFIGMRERVETSPDHDDDNLDTLGTLNPTYAEPLTRTSSYYLQFAEGFCHRYLGRHRDNLPCPTGRDGITYFDLEQQTPAMAALRPVGWRVLTSTYFAAQQMRSANWNLWYRVRRSERRFALGLLLVAGFFVVNATNGILIQRAAAPTPPLDVSFGEDGVVRVEHAAGANEGDGRGAVEGAEEGDRAPTW
ncbi:MAG: hypothetical protein ACFCBV_07800 [Phycisphaerales bacterium]